MIRVTNRVIGAVGFFQWAGNFGKGFPVSTPSFRNENEFPSPAKKSWEEILKDINTAQKLATENYYDQTELDKMANEGLRSYRLGLRR